MGWGLPFVEGSFHFFCFFLLFLHLLPTSSFSRSVSFRCFLFQFRFSLLFCFRKLTGFFLCSYSQGDQIAGKEAKARKVKSFPTNILCSLTNLCSVPKLPIPMVLAVMTPHHPRNTTPTAVHLHNQCGI